MLHGHLLRGPERSLRLCSEPRGLPGGLGRVLCGDARVRWRLWLPRGHGPGPLGRQGSDPGPLPRLGRVRPGEPRGRPGGGLRARVGGPGQRLRERCVIAQAAVTLALQADGVLWGWGVPSYWQPPEGLLFQRIAAGKSHSCGIDLNGSVHCWGIQDGGNWDFGQVTLTPTQGSYIDVAAGYNHSCAVQSDGAVVCWGIGSEDNLTEAQEPYEKGQVKDTPTEAMFLEVGAGHSFSCGLKTDGGVQCWGGGSGMTNVPTETDFVSLTVGFHHACPLDSSGAIVLGLDQARPDRGCARGRLPVGLMWVWAHLRGADLRRGGLLGGAQRERRRAPGGRHRSGDRRAR